MNRAVASLPGQLRAVAVLDGTDQAVDAFLRIFPLDADVIHDPAGDLSEQFSVHFRPFALLYTPSGQLASKNHMANPQDIDRLLGPLNESTSVSGSDTTPRGRFAPASR